MDEDLGIDDQLLAYHMGWLSRSEMAAVERLVASSPRIAELSRALQDSIAPLEDWSSMPAVDNLESQVLRRVQRETGSPVAPLQQPVKLDPVPPGAGVMLRFPFSVKELLAVAASLAVLFTLALPALTTASARAQRTACADHLRHIAAALGDYAHDHTGQLPFAGSVDPAAGRSVQAPAPGNWLREKTAGVRRLRNSRNRFLLLARGYVGDAATFVCPADRDAIVMRSDGLSRFEDFAESRNCSYDSQIMFGGGQRVSKFPQKVVYSDSNPVFDFERSAGEDPSMLNSRVHRGSSGQNVVRLDGAVTWTTSPNVGVQNDNIWRIGQRLNYTGRELPRFSTDSFMIP